jgi:altronate dehydratase
MLENSSISRFVTLVHTEGCGASFNTEFHNTLLGYLSHPFVKHALLLEHGCEATHNDFFRHAMKMRGYDPEDYGWASIQLDGGIQTVIQKMIHWFEKQIDNDPEPEKIVTGLETLRIALVSNGIISPQMASVYAQLTQMIVTSGGTVIVAENDALLQTDYIQQLAIEESTYPSLGYAQFSEENGFHIMAMPTRDLGEILTGIGAAGLGMIVSPVDSQAMLGHPMIPVLQVSETQHNTIDLFLNGTTEDKTQQILKAIADTHMHLYTPKLVKSGNSNFQVTRGLLGVSL